MSKQIKQSVGQADGHSNQKNSEVLKAYLKEKFLETAYFAAAEMSAVVNFVILVVLALGVSELLYWASQGIFVHAMADMGWLVKGVKYLLFVLAAGQLLKRAVLHLFGKAH